MIHSTVPSDMTRNLPCVGDVHDYNTTSGIANVRLCRCRTNIERETFQFLGDRQTASAAQTHDNPDQLQQQSKRTAEE